MKQWEINRIRFNKEHSNEINDIHDRVYHKESYNEILSYFKDANHKITYPSKAIFVNIIYASLLHEYFNEDFYVSLNDYNVTEDKKDLILYKDSKELYDKIINEVIDKDYKIKEKYKCGMFISTAKYFKQEMLNQFDIFHKKILNNILVTIKDNEVVSATQDDYCYGIYDNGNIINSGIISLYCDNYNSAQIGDIVFKHIIPGVGVCVKQKEIDGVIGEVYNKCVIGSVCGLPEKTQSDIGLISVKLNDTAFF